MYNAKYIFGGLLIFLALVILPILPNLGKAVPPPKPQVDTPAIQKLAGQDKQCVEDTAWMRANHMLLLNDWREEVVRTGKREYTGKGGKKYNPSLSNTCMECHSNKSQFCDQCHNYVAVVPNCWGCHLEKEKKVAKAEAK
ncbi:MAG: menaquinol oxidoreductase [Deltaproteobacteria bacterium]|nr:menaquinol oxidoreductase [Deltaproteobacteria bacterium]